MIKPSVLLKHRWIWTLLIVIAAIITCFFAARYAIHERFCSHDSRVIPGAGDYDVLIEVEDCNGFGSDTIVGVKLRDKGPWHFEDIALIYEPVYDVGNFSNTPDVKWIDSKNLQISVNTVSQIRREIGSINGIHITYRIGKTSYPRSDE